MKKIKESKFEYILLIFLVVGIGLLIGSGFLLKIHLDNKKNCLPVSAEITAIYSYDDSHRVYVSYEVDGVIYNDVRYNEYNSSMYEGKIITIYYNPENPGEIESVNGNLIACIMLAIMGVIFSLVGAIIPIKKMKETLSNKKIKQTGTPINCFVTELKVDRSIRVNGKYTNYFLFCRPFNDETKNYKSASFKFEHNISEGDILKVYVDSHQSDKYYVDLSSLDGRNINMLPQDEIPEINYEGVDTSNQSQNKIKYCRYCGSRIDGEQVRCPACNSNID